MALIKHGIRAKIWSHFGGPNRRERERGEERRKQEEEEEEGEGEGDQNQCMFSF